MNKLTKKIIVKGTLTCKTGLHIGGSKESVGIGDNDNPVIRLALGKQQPYIPGSSLKGKMRSLMQLVAGEPDEKQYNSPVSKLFGSTDKDKNNPGNPSRIIVRDAYLNKESDEELFGSSNTDMPYTEIKWEYRIDRVLGKAEHPRQTERVPAGAKFDIAFVLNIFDGDDEKQLLDTFKKAISLLEDDYLGGSGTRGYGQVGIDLKWDKMQTRELKMA